MVGGSEGRVGGEEHVRRSLGNRPDDLVALGLILLWGVVVFLGAVIVLFDRPFDLVSCLGLVLVILWWF